MEYNENTNTYEILDEQGYNTIGYMSLDNLVRLMELEIDSYEP